MFSKASSPASPRPQDFTNHIPLNTRAQRPRVGRAWSCSVSTDDAWGGAGRAQGSAGRRGARGARAGRVELVDSVHTMEELIAAPPQPSE